MAATINEMFSTMENSFSLREKKKTRAKVPDFNYSSYEAEDGVRGLKGSASVNITGLAKKFQLQELKLSSDDAAVNLTSWDSSEPSEFESKIPGVSSTKGTTSPKFIETKAPESLYMGAPRDPDLEAVRKKSLEDFKLIIDNNQDIDKADVLYDSVGEDERLVVIAGTAEKLTDLLSDPSHNDPEYILQFLLTYSYHTTAEKVLASLTEKYDQHDEYEWRNKILWVVKKWIENAFNDFLDDKKLMDQLIAFIGKTLPATGNLDAAKSLHEDITNVTTHAQTRKDEKFESSKDSSVPKPSVPKIKEGEKATFLDFKPGEVARQLTLIDFEKYKEIPVKEFLKQSWNTKECEQVAPHIMTKIRNFNDISYWAATEVVFTPNTKQRVSVVKRLIHIAEKCLEYHNFNTAMAVIAGLHLSSISRLKKTWKNVPTKFIESFESMTQLLSTEGNYKNYRVALMNATPPINPYFGIFLRDLTFMEVGNQEQLENLVNFDALRMISGVLRDIVKYQQFSYKFERVEVIQDYLSNAMRLDDQALLKYSLLCEPSYGDGTSRKKEKK